MATKTVTGTENVHLYQGWESPTNSRRKVRMKYPNMDWGTMEAVVNKIGGMEGVGAFLRDETKIVPANAIVTMPQPPPEPALDFVVRVDRSVKPIYPDWIKKVIHPELELAGPAEYNLQDGVEQWLHDDQKRGSVVGGTIHKHLQKGDALATCLNLQDGLAIQQKGIAVFRKLFAGKVVIMWGSVVQGQSGDLFVPCLSEGDGGVVLDWFWLGNNFLSSFPALRLR